MAVKICCLSLEIRFSGPHGHRLLLVVPGCESKEVTGGLDEPSVKLHNV